MYKFIPEQITWSLNNKCTWELWQRTRTIDNFLDVTKGWSKVEDSYLYTTEPTEISVRDVAIFQGSYSLVPTTSIVKVWIKNLEINFDSFDYGLKNIERISPCQEDLGIITGFFIALRGQEAYGINRDQWLYLAKNN